MQQDKEHLKKMLNRYRRGRSDKKEIRRLAVWLAGLDLYETEKVSFQQEELLSRAKLRAKLQPAGNRKVFKIPAWGRAAAAVLLLAIGFWSIRQYENRGQEAAVIAWASVYTSAGEMKQVTLSDGTQVLLNGMSTLSYPQAFDPQARQIKLSGQAFFKVRHESKRSFLVSTGKLTVQVLGTSFDVKAYQDEKTIDVAVSSGKVGLIVNGQTTRFLTAGQALTFDHGTDKFKDAHPGAGDIGSWQQRRLVFRNASLAQITRDLQRQFKVRFEFKSDQLKAKKLNLNIRNQNLEDVMKALSGAGDFRYQISNGVVELW